MMDATLYQYDDRIEMTYSLFLQEPSQYVLNTEMITYNHVTVSIEPKIPIFIEQRDRKSIKYVVIPLIAQSYTVTWKFKQ